MALQMTRTEYEAKYGVAPFIQPVSDLDIRSAPVRMTREEYNAKYPTDKSIDVLAPAKEAISGLGTLYGGGEQGIARKLAEDVRAGAKDIEEGKILKGVAKAGLRTAGDVAGLIFAPIGAAIQATGFNKLTDYIAEKVVKSPLGEAITDIPIVQKFAITHPNAEEDFSRALNLLLAKEEKGKIEPKTAIPRTVEQVKGIIGTPPPPEGGIGTGIRGIPSKIQEYRATRATEKVAQEIANIEKNYAQLRKAEEFSKDAEASRKRIAQTDVLVDSVDKDGTIRTTQPGGAVEQYRKLTLDGAEGVVRDNLIREGKKVNLGEVATALTLEVNRSGLEGANLLRAVKGLKAELEGLRLRADELGNIDLSKIHDAKISTTQNINYKTDSTPTIKYRKAKARAYKTLVENKSDISVDVNGKKYGVPEINKELGKYYEDIERLGNLDGRKVRGGKLGKYTARIGGQITGGAVGGALGGFTGAAIGSAVGGETAAFLKGKAMERTFGKGTGKDVISNAILERAKVEGKLPPEVNLKISDVVVGSPKGIPKTKEIFKVERDIVRNVKQQKAAIKAGDFALVAGLKEIYTILVQHLKDSMKKAKEAPIKKDISDSSTKTGKPLQEIINRSRETLDKTTTIPKELQPLAQEARKFKSAEEFANALAKKQQMAYEKLSQADKQIIDKSTYVYNNNPKKYKNIQEAANDLGFGEKYKRIRDSVNPLLKTNIKNQSQLTDFYNQAKGTNNLKTAIPEMSPETAQILRGTKGMTAKDIMAKHPDIKLTRDVPATDIYGNKVKIPDGEVLTPYELKGNKILLQDGETYIVSKNQFQNIKGNAITGEAKPFAPELKGTQETVKGTQKMALRDKAYADFEAGKITREQRNAIIDKLGVPNETKYSQYQLPDGKNYKEILIKAPMAKPEIIGKDGKVIGDYRGTFRSSHWEERNVISHIRMNERTYNGKKVAFMEELQSDWAREGRSKGFVGERQQTFEQYREELGKKYNVKSTDKDGFTTQKLIQKITNDESNKLHKLQYDEIPFNPLLKNWQELSIKRALKDAVDSNAEYFSWINGEQTSARYNLATHLDNVKWEKQIAGRTGITLKPKSGEKFGIVINEKGIITDAVSNSAWEGKKLDEVLGKGLADKIMEKETGTLSGEGLKFGGEWANNLYDKQVGNIVSDLTGAKVEKLDLGLPIDNKVQTFFNQKTFNKLKPNDLEVGLEISSSKHGGVGSDNYIITDILGDGKFKAVPKEHYDVLMKYKPNEKIHYNNALYPNRKTAINGQAKEFDISTKKTTQQGIKLTPEIKAKIQGKAQTLKRANLPKSK